jgi:hypothetical protein
MGIQYKQGADGGLGLEGKDTGNGTFIHSVVNYNVPVATTAVCVINPGRSMVIDSIIGRPFVAGTGGAATVALWKAPSGTAPISGTALHSGTFNMVGTIHTDQTLTLTTTTLAAGEAIWAVFTGTATSAIGSIAVNLRPA